MRGSRHVRPADLRGLSRLAVEATSGLTDLVEALHGTIGKGPAAWVVAGDRTAGITGFVYDSVRGVTRLVGTSLDSLFAPLTHLIGENGSSAEREAVLAALNGVLGDHLTETANPLAIAMELRLGGKALTLSREALRAAVPLVGPRIAVFVHGLCMNDLQWGRNGVDPGADLARELGYTPLHLRYCTGLHVSENGRALADLLETLVEEWPEAVPDLLLVGHSMGGLVLRSAHHHAVTACRRWPGRASGYVFLGTPHHGAPLERLGSWVDVLLGSTPYSAPFDRLGKIRSAGITDLRFGNLLDEDWQCRDRFARGADARRLVPLPAGAPSYALAATRGKGASDGLVPVKSALGIHDDETRSLGFPEGHRSVVASTGHLELLQSSEVWSRVRTWLS